MTKIKASQRKGKGGLAALTAGQKQEELALMASSGAMAQGGHFAGKRSIGNGFAMNDADQDIARIGNGFAMNDADQDIARIGNGFAMNDADSNLAIENGYASSL